jgi:dTDP-4-dehydrorhamnose reductase
MEAGAVLSRSSQLLESVATVIVGSNTRIICPGLLETAKVVSSTSLLEGNKHCLEAIASASAVIFASYCRDGSGHINHEASVETARLVSRIMSDPARLLYLSTDGVFSGRRGAYSVNEAPDPVTEYGTVKARQEEVFHRGVILRFTTMGPSFSNRPLIAEIVKSELLVMGYPNAYFSPVSTWSMNHVLEQHLGSRLLPGIYHIATERVSKQSLFQALAKKMGISLCISEDASVVSDHSLRASPGLVRVLNTEMNLTLGPNH